MTTILFLALSVLLYLYIDKVQEKEIYKEGYEDWLKRVKKLQEDKKDIVQYVIKITKQHENQLAKERIDWEDERCQLEKKIEKLENSNSSYKGWNTKYMKEIKILKNKLELKK